MKTDLDRLCINTLRLLAADMIEEAQTGHPGTPMGVAPVAYVLWTRFLRHNPCQPHWAGRDRFVLSNGHASALLYSLLHLTGYGLTLEDLKRFRKTHSLTPGHPELHATPGIEITTGPLGQGFASAVGMAMAEAHLEAEFNRPDAPKIVDHYTYVLCSDGDMMEGVTAEAASLAGHLGLGRLICLYDSNHVTIDGPTSLTYSEDIAMRYRAYGWHIQEVEDGNDLDAVEAAIRQAQAETSRPSFVIIHTLIGFGSPARQGKAAAHWGAFGEAELRATRDNLGWMTYEHFYVPPEVARHFGTALASGESWSLAWDRDYRLYAEKYPAEAAEFQRRMARQLPNGWEACLPHFAASAAGEPVRLSDGPIINSLAPVLPELLGGSGDLSTNTQALVKSSGDFEAGQYANRNIRYGIREHAMAAITNGLALHGGLRPFCATFLVFSDYMRPSLRLAALTGAPSIFLFTNDSVGLGEDGPTHQPVEQIASLRAMPNLTVIRPCDSNEAVEAWKAALNNLQGPTCLLLSKQPVPVLDRTVYAPAEGLQRGAYVLSEAASHPQAILIGTGSEVHLALQAQKLLAGQGIHARVVSMPSWELFQKQSLEYRARVLPPAVKARVSIEAGASLGWERWVGEAGRVIGLDHFGASGAAQELFAEYGFTAEAVAGAVVEMLS
jgi:transketolase